MLNSSQRRFARFILGVQEDVAANIEVTAEKYKKEYGVNSYALGVLEEAGFIKRKQSALRKYKWNDVDFPDFPSVDCIEEMRLRAIDLNTPLQIVASNNDCTEIAISEDNSGFASKEDVSEVKGLIAAQGEKINALIEALVGGTTQPSLIGMNEINGEELA